jgi:hypothetical protein
MHLCIEIIFQEMHRIIMLLEQEMYACTKM